MDKTTKAIICLTYDDALETQLNTVLKGHVDEYWITTFSEAVEYVSSE